MTIVRSALAREVQTVWSALLATLLQPLALVKVRHHTVFIYLFLDRKSHISGLLKCQLGYTVTHTQPIEHGNPKNMGNNAK